MKLKILGCSGGKSIGQNPTSFLLDDKLLIDAGTVISKVDPRQLVNEIDNLVLTHSHIDHIADLPFLAQLAYEEKQKPFTVHASDECTEVVFESIFNFNIWPDLFELSKENGSNLRWKNYKHLELFEVGGYEVTPVFVNHTVPTYGFIIDDGESSFAFSADTYLTDKFWEECGTKDNLDAIIIDVSFPSHMSSVAEATRHLTPDLLLQELEKLGSKNPNIFITHIKPQLLEEVKTELRKKFGGRKLFILSENIDIYV